eukprot:CAMPEP_0175137108 /NCGR_PEP_ID=MMETSP0087-20121206/9635_1 /TAXON_ID=136419 /ORGANISM="Unknown Unknown, Strain D1" /LENGTH=613 /DNA_ID=CAMNT_0016419913 /DNA_START=235 /DNA_END=2073 /DNA_ORIENTATION=-
MLASNSPSGRHLLATSNTTNKCEFKNEQHREAFLPHPSFSLQDRKDGAVALEILGMLYMFIGLAMVCDEYFENSLASICDALSLQEDVAGATFMAAGSSAPELFTSIMGVFFAASDVGIGTIVGSAVFNVLIIIGLCCLVASGTHLSWWPLTRDACFYCVTIFALVLMVEDSKISVVEAVVCLVLYILYVMIMYFNRKLGSAMVNAADRAKNAERAQWRVSLQKFCDGLVFQIFMSVAIVVNLVFIAMDFTYSVSPDWLYYANMAFAGLYILEMLLKMIAVGWFNYWRDPTNTFDGILVGLIFVEFTLQALSSSSGSQSTSKVSGARGLRLLKIFRAFRTARCLRLIFPAKEVIKRVGSLVPGDVSKTKGPATAKQAAEGGEASKMPQMKTTTGNKQEQDAEMLSLIVTKHEKEKAEEEKKKQEEEQENGDNNGDDDGDDEDDDPANPFEIPDSCGGKVWWLLTFPLAVLMWLSIPDVRNDKFKKWYFMTFLMSIVWIAAMSFCMVWWATVFGETFNIPSPVMGLTLLAAGTSIPDTIASVNVARKKGQGDMAVSNSIGSNIFDILIGLGLPWFINTVMGKEQRILSNSLEVSILILFITVAIVVMLIHGSGW